MEINQNPENLPILVIGATGKTGRRVAEKLTDKGINVRGGSRTADIPFDWDLKETWAPALAGTRAAYITYYPDLAFPGVSELIAEFCEVAKANDVKRLVLLSGRGEEGARASEVSVENSGAEWTVVRCNWFNQNFDESFFLEPVLSGEIAIPAGDAVEPFIDANDIADVAVAALTEDGHHGEVYELSGPRLLSFTDVAAELSDATGRHIKYAPVSPEEYAAVLAEAGLPEDFVELFTMILDGRNASLTDGVQRALGREPKDFGDYAREAAATGVWDTSDQLAAQNA
ncbi:NAD(P)H-binding protein [Arthrobacter sp. H5]|uniref:NAD(P)H-binding protein n=1 Tax=Arthrobacter sp. H5 TaxID=1267973 RepID=UPI0004BC21EB|nr:NAD(P)H-binding protein [Arthrobacter sp. H5]